MSVNDVNSKSRQQATSNTGKAMTTAGLATANPVMAGAGIAVQGANAIEKAMRSEIEALKSRHKRQIDTIDSIQRDYKAELRIEHDAQIDEIQKENQKQIAKEGERKEKVLEQMRNHLQLSKQMTSKELEDLREMTAKARSMEEIKLSEQRNRLNEDHEIYVDDINHKFNQQVKKVNTEGKNRIEKMVDVKNEEYLQKEAHNDQRLRTQTDAFNQRFRLDGQNYKTMKDVQDKTFKKEREATNIRQQVDMAKMTTTHNDLVEKRDGEYRKDLKNQDLFFEKKYTDTLKGHNEQLKGLNDLHAKVETKMKEDLKEKLTGAIMRSDDAFYQFTELKPTLTQYPDRVEVKVDVPDYSKQDLSLTINGKEAVVSFNRRFDDTHKGPGAVNKVHKVESYTTRLLTDHFLDAKSVKSSYENGTMTYVIKRA